MKKIKKSKRILIFILCLVLICSQSLLVLANGEASDSTVAASSTEVVQPDVADSAAEAVIEEATEAVSEEATEVVSEETTEVVTEETTEAVPEEATEVVTEETTEVVTEETTEVVTEETTEVVTEETEDVVAEETTEVVEEEITPVTVFNYESDEVIVVVTLTNPEDLPVGAELVVEPINLTGEQEIGIGVAANEDNIILKEIHAFDIKFMLNDEEIQPGETVKVVITLPGMDMDEDTAVYHIDENNNIENMSGAVNDEGNVEFETPHFSTYVVVPTEDGTSNINGAANYGLLKSSGDSGEVLEYDKTAKIDNWDERTYDITISARATLTETIVKQRISDGMLIVDMSGSMLRTLQGTKYAEGEAAQVRLGYYNEIKDTLDKDTIYYIQTKKTTSAYIAFPEDYNASNDSTSRVMTYLDYDGTEADGWYYYNVTLLNTVPRSGKTYQADKWVKMADNSTFTVYDWSALRISTLKQMVLTYMNSVATNSPDSYLGMTTFYEVGYEVLPFESIATGNKLKVDVIQRFAALRPQREWCTYPNKGLSLAFKSMVSSNSTYNANTYDSELQQKGKVTVGTINEGFNRTIDGETVGKYIILFSDGEPDATDNDSTEIPKIERETKAWAKAFRDAGVTVYTVAFAYNKSDSTWLNDIASPGCTYTADTVGELEAVLTQIKESETVAADYVEVDVEDYIDPRFVIVDNGVQLTEEYIETNGQTDSDGTKYIEIETTGYDGDTAVTRTGKVYYDDNGYQVIKWDDEKAMKEGSTWTVKVQAQDDYIGGNDVATNVDALSVIDAGDYGTFDLPDPVVNVKATMEIGNNNLYIYKGTTAPNEYSEATDPLTMYKAVQDDIERYLAPGYTGVEATDFVVKWYTDASCTTEIPMDEIDDDYLQNEANYYLKFTYDPGDASEESNSNTTKDDITYISGRDDGSDNGIVEAVNTADSSKQYGIYNIKLWQIIKRSSSSADLPLEGVEFEIVENTTGSTYYGKSDTNGFVALFTNSECTVPAADTPIGTYTLSEIKTVEGYTLSGETWTINAAYENEPDISDVTSSTGEAVITETPSGVVISYIYVNDPYVYELPSTGSTGIYGYLIFGVALIMGGTMIIYKRRRMEVLRRR